MACVHEINEIDQLDQFADTWHSLLAQTPRGNFFQSLDWLKVYWKHYGKHQKLRVLIMQDDGGYVAGILPLVVRWETTKLGRVRYLTYPLDYWGSFYGPIGACPRQVLAAGLEHIRNTKCDWDAIELRWAGSADFDAAQTASTLESQGLSACRTTLNQTALIRLHELTWDDYLASRGTKWRNNFRRWERRATELGEISLLRYRPRGEAHGEGDPRWDLYDACLSLAERSWQGASTTGTTLSHPSVRQYLRDTHEAAARAGGLDLNLLMAGGEPVVFAYNYYHQGYVFGLRIGHDERNSKYSLGNLIYARVLEDSFRRGDQVYDMGPSHIEAKQSLLTEVHTIYRYSHFRKASVRGQLLRLKRVWDGQSESAREAAAIPTIAGAPA